MDGREKSNMKSWRFGVKTVIWLSIIQTARREWVVMPNNVAIFYCGTNGAGKSTLRAFNQDTVQIVIDSDQIAM